MAICRWVSCNEGLPLLYFQSQGRLKTQNRSSPYVFFTHSLHHSKIIQRVILYKTHEPTQSFFNVYQQHAIMCFYISKPTLTELCATLSWLLMWFRGWKQNASQTRLFLLHVGSLNTSATNQQVTLATSDEIAGSHVWQMRLRFSYMLHIHAGALGG